MNHEKRKSQSVKKEPEQYVSDFETLTVNSEGYNEHIINGCPSPCSHAPHTAVWLWGIKNLKHDTIKTGDTIESWYEEIFKDGLNKTIFFHNLKFDGAFIEPFLINKTNLMWMDLYDNITGSRELERNSFTIFRSRANIYSIKIKRRVKVGNKWRDPVVSIKCSFKLLSVSIGALAKDYNRQKIRDDIEIDYDKGGFNLKGKVLDDWITYLYDDITTQSLAMNDLLTNLQNDKHFKYNNKGISDKKILTIGGTTIKLYHNYLKDKRDEYSESDEFEWDEIAKDNGSVGIFLHLHQRNWYTGGFTQFNPLLLESQALKNYTDIKEGIAIDINSAYPWALTQILPYGRPKSVPWEKSDKYENLEYLEIEVNSAVIKPKYYNTAIWLKNWHTGSIKNSRYSRQLYSFKCYYLRQEWDLLNKVYDFDIKSIKSSFYKASKYIKDFIEPLYDIKWKSKRDGNLAKSHTAKIQLNSFYGQLGKRHQYPQLIGVDEDTYNFMRTCTLNKFKFTLGKSTYILTKISTKRTGEWRYIEAQLIDKKLRKAPPVLVGATVTAYSRILLWKTILNIGHERFLYSDTDSIFLKANESRVAHLLDDLKLGAFSIESKFNRITVGGAKRYAVSNKDGSPVKIGFAGVQVSKLKYSDIIDILTNNGIITEAGLKAYTDTHGMILVNNQKNIRKGTI